MVLLKLFLTFFKIGLFTVGGGYAMISFVEKEAVDINKWITKKDFLDIVALDSVTPGPIAVNMATFIGYRVHGVLGGVIATIGVVLPSLILVTIMAALFYAFRDNKVIQAVMKGLRPAIVALILAAVLSLLQGKAIFDIKGIILAVLVFAGVVVLKLHPVWMVAFAGFAGMVLYLR